MRREEKDSREGIERWIDERIRAALTVLTVPFESRIKQLRKRVERLEAKLRHLSGAVEPGSEAGKVPREREKTNPP